MKEYKIGYSSDEHLDFYCFEKNTQAPKFKRQIKNYIEKFKGKDAGGDILLCGGDTSHYDDQTKEYLTQMNELYTHVFIVSGNHDLYLVSDKQQRKYSKNSINRVNEMKEWCDNQTNIHYLDGNVVNIDGLKIGGLGNWYNLDTLGKIASWNEIMNDSNLIMEGAEPIRFQYGYGASHKESQWDTQAHRKTQEDAMKRIQEEKCDILLTHIIPTIIPDEFLFHGHHGESANIFYMSDDIEEVKKTGAEIVVYGHNHEVRKWDYEGIEWKTNAVGYPQEYTGFEGIQHFYFIKE